MRKWNRTRDILPKEHVIVETKIDDGNGCRNQQNLYRYGNLWFFPDGSMYVYYTPTHWREMKRGGEQEEIRREHEINGSGIRDPAAEKAIREADQQPEEVSKAIRIMKFTARCHGLEVENRICLVDKETGERWP